MQFRVLVTKASCTASISTVRYGGSSYPGRMTGRIIVVQSPIMCSIFERKGLVSFSAELLVGKFTLLYCLVSFRTDSNFYRKLQKDKFS